MDRALKEAGRILIRLPNWVGDVVMAIPALETVRRNCPHATIALAVRKYARGVVEDGPWADRIIDVSDKSLRGFFRTARLYRDFGADAAIVMPNSFRTALNMWWAGARKIYGYRRNGRGLFLTGGPRPQREGRKIRPVPMTEYYLELCRHLGMEIPEKTRARLFISDELARRGDRLLESLGVKPGEMLVGIVPGAKFGSSKCWPVENFVELAEALKKEFDCRLLVLPGPGEEPIAERIEKESSAEVLTAKVDLAMLKPVIRRCGLVITNDTGPRHYAEAFDVPAVVIMGPTDPRFTDCGAGRSVVLRSELDCSPCHKKICPTDHRCMTDIKAGAVVEAARQLVVSAGSKAG